MLCLKTCRENVMNDIFSTIGDAGAATWEWLGSLFATLWQFTTGNAYNAWDFAETLPGNMMFIAGAISLFLLQFFAKKSMVFATVFALCIIGAAAFYGAPNAIASAF